MAGLSDRFMVNVYSVLVFNFSFRVALWDIFED